MAKDASGAARNSATKSFDSPCSTNTLSFFSAASAIAPAAVTTLSCGTDVFGILSALSVPLTPKTSRVMAVERPLRVRQQPDNRYQFWAEVPDWPGRFLRVVTLEDKMTIHNAFFDRRFKP